MLILTPLVIGFISFTQHSFQAFWIKLETETTKASYDTDIHTEMNTRNT